jgi:hypothetical protein
MIDSCLLRFYRAAAAADDDDNVDVDDCRLLRSSLTALGNATGRHKHMQGCAYLKWSLFEAPQLNDVERSFVLG